MALGANDAHLGILSQHSDYDEDDGGGSSGILHEEEKINLFRHCELKMTSNDLSNDLLKDYGEDDAGGSRGIFHGEEKINLFHHCEVEMKTTSNDSLSNDLLKAQASVLVPHLKAEYDDIMVETRACQRAKEMLDESHSVVISGCPGDGKTTLAVHLTLSLEADGYLPVVVYSPADVQRCCNPYEKMVFLLDDVFGKSHLIRESLDDWERKGSMISQLVSASSGNTKLIFTCRNDILHNCLAKVNGITAFENLIDLQSSSLSLNSSEKTSIFNNLVTKYQGSNGYSDYVINMFCNEFNIIGFPATCRLLAIRGGQCDPYEVMNAPFTFLLKEIRRMSVIGETRLQYAILVLVMLYNGRLPQRLLSDTRIREGDKIKVHTVLTALAMEDIDIPSRVLSNAALTMRSYITRKDGEWIFVDYATKNAVSVVFCKDHLDIFIQYADRGDLYKLLDAKDESSISVKMTPTVFIDREHYSELVREMTKDVLQGRHDMVFKTRCLRDENFRAEWLMHLMENQCLNNFMQATDDYNKTPLYYLALYDRRDMLSCCLSALSKDDDSLFPKWNNSIFPDKRPHIGLLDAFYGSIEGGNTDARDMIMQMWSDHHCTDIKESDDLFHFMLAAGPVDDPGYTMLHLRTSRGSNAQSRACRPIRNNDTFLV